MVCESMRAASKSWAVWRTGPLFAGGQHFRVGGAARPWGYLTGQQVRSRARDAIL